MITILKNGNVLVDDKIQRKNVVLSDGKIESILNLDETMPDGQILDCQGKFIFPGFIDLHIHGSGGGYSQNVSAESYEKIIKSQIQFGTTSICLTFIGPSDEELSKAIEIIQTTNDKEIGAEIVGVHLEGPWISPKKIGYLSKDLFEFFGNADHAREIVNICGKYLKIVTLAPELENIQDVIKVLTDKGVIVSCGHTEANFEIAKLGVGWGIKSFTHLWNMSGPIQSRDPGVVGCALSFDDCFIELVADGYHVHPVNIRNSIVNKPEGKVCLVTDAMIVTGTSETTYSFMGVNDIKVIGGRTCGPNNSIVGSVLTQDRAVRNVIEWTKFPIEKVVKMVTENPAKALGMYPQKGCISINSDADLAIFNDDLTCSATIVGGKLLYKQ